MRKAISIQRKAQKRLRRPKRKLRRAQRKLRRVQEQSTQHTKWDHGHINLGMAKDCLVIAMNALD
jgi:hypothetical protein